jgi:hypothetical protein
VDDAKEPKWQKRLRSLSLAALPYHEQAPRIHRFQHR